MSASKEKIKNALAEICREWHTELPAKLVIEAPKEARFGDLSTNIALLLAKPLGKKPRDLALDICGRLLGLCTDIDAADAAGPGFINIRFKPRMWHEAVITVEKSGNDYGHTQMGAGRRALVEYVSANPTGPLHVGHGRGAALGDSIARILSAAGYDVDTEYYLNDAGRQMRILGRSIWLRAQEELGQAAEFPDDCYKGGYIRDLARALLAEKPELARMAEDEGMLLCQNYGMKEILRGIKEDLDSFHCRQDRYASEADLVLGGKVQDALNYLAAQGKTWEEDGALWLNTVDSGDDRNRVLRKSDGNLTYLASDIAYHHDKFQRGYDWLIDVWGADHHGYIARMRAAIGHMGHDPEKFSVVLVQLVNLLQRGELVAMSTRAGQFETLQDVLKEVGPDAARFIFLSRSSDSPLDFDLELARERSMDNPVYYVQYAHARICALMRRAEERGLKLPGKNAGLSRLEPLDKPEELGIMRLMEIFPDTVDEAAKNLAPHHIARYLQELSGTIHSYYAKCKILDENDKAGTDARLTLLRAAAQVVRNGLDLLGVSAPEAM